MEGHTTTWSVGPDHGLLWLLFSWIPLFSAIVLSQSDLKFLELKVINFTKMGRTVLVLYHLDGCLRQSSSPAVVQDVWQSHLLTFSTATCGQCFSEFLICFSLWFYVPGVDITVKNLKSCWLTYFPAYWLIKQMCLVGPRNRHIHSPVRAAPCQQAFRFSWDGSAQRGMCTGLFDAMQVSGFPPEDPVLPAYGECSVPQVQHHDFLWKFIVLGLCVFELAFSGIF